MSDAGSVSLDLIGKVVLDIQGELRGLRSEQRDMRSLVLALAYQGRRIERRLADVDRRFNDLRDELELMMKAELMGRLGHFETQMEHRLDALAERIPT
jgi:hypothetical protein